MLFSFYTSVIRPILFKFDPEAVHEFTMSMLHFVGRSPLKFLLRQKVMSRPVEVMGLTFPNPVGLAAGLDKNGVAVDGLGEFGFGFIEVGTVTPVAQPGNPKKRLFRVIPAEGIINRMGFNNDGVDELINNIYDTGYKGILGINIGKNKVTPLEKSTDDYLICMDRVYPYADYITVNISSPNTPDLRKLQYGDAFEQLLEALKNKQRDLASLHGKYVPLVIKIAPDVSDEELDAAFRPNTKAVFGETIANPALIVFDIERFAKAAHAHGVPLIVDNTFATPINCRPFEWGADIVTHSTTKYMDGHDATVGGCIIDSGNFDWMAHADKFPGLTTPDESYHGITYAEKFGKEGAFITKATAQLMRDLGSIQAPMNAYFLNLGLESLALRMKRHCENALEVARFLETCEQVGWVNYPDLPGNKYYERAQKYLPNGSCGVIAFGIKGGRSAAEAFMSRLKVAMIATHVADAHTCILHPANSTHRQLSDEELIAGGVGPDLIRLSVGIENVEDIIEDLKQALKGE